MIESGLEKTVDNNNQILENIYLKKHKIMRSLIMKLKTRMISRFQLIMLIRKLYGMKKV